MEGIEAYTSAVRGKRKLPDEDSLGNRANSDPAGFCQSATAELLFVSQISYIDGDTISLLRSSTPASDAGQRLMCTKSEETIHLQANYEELSGSKHLSPEDNSGGTQKSMFGQPDFKPTFLPTLYKGSGQYSCPRCSKKFIRQCDAGKHLRSHVEPLKCLYPDCKYDSFAVARDLKRHFQDAHTLRIPIACPFPECTRTFTRQDNCDRHVQRTHRSSYEALGPLNQAALKNPDSDHERFLELKTQHGESEVIESSSIPLGMERFNMNFTAENSTYALDEWLQSIHGPFSGFYTLDFEEITLDRGVTTEKDMPFTDSGYASVPHQNLPPNVPSSIEQPKRIANAKPSIKMDDGDREDATTLYSAATTLAPTHAQNYIDELCRNIYSKLEEYFDGKSWRTQSKALHEALPGLIKAFAIKIGHDSSALVNQEIMYFIHKRHKEIIVQLETIFRYENDDGPKIYRTDSADMSVREKVNMWNNRAGQDCSAIEIGDLFIGVKDDEDEIIDAVDLAVYCKTILNSAAYKWLLASLRKEFFLQWSATQPRVMVDSIRQRIADKLPTGIISKRRALSAYEVKFDLQWGDIRKDTLSNELFERLVSPERSFAEFIIVTGSPEEAQALTVRQYMSHTWPTSGSQLLDVIQKCIIHHDHHCSAILPDNTQLAARICGTHLIITATGPAYFIAECGEQLAWLRAALLSNSEHFVGYCTPSITMYSVDPALPLSKKPTHKGECDIGFEIASVGSEFDSAPRSQNYWGDLVGESVVIVGYPISRRPEDFTGLELNFNTLLHILQADKATTANGTIIVVGSKRTLQLTKHRDGVFLWHPLHSFFDFCSCCMKHFGINGGIFRGPIDLYNFEAGRHIFSKCTDLQNVSAENIDPIFDKPCLSETRNFQNEVSIEINTIDDPGNSAHNPTAIDQNRSISVLPESQIDEIVSKSLITSGLLYSVSEDDLSSLEGEYAKSNSLFNSPNVLEADSQSIITGGSPGDSLDSDFLSISDSSEQVEPLDANEPAYPVLSAVLYQLLSGFQSITQHQLSPGENGEVSATTGSSITSSTTTDISKKCRKRVQETEEDDDDAGQDGFRRPQRKRINPGQGKAPQRSLACPYLKLDPIKHRNCCANQLSRIRDVKQHLTRSHTPARYCQRCLGTDFRDDQTLERHLDLNTCPRNDPSILEGFSHQRQRQLSRKSNRLFSEADQWYAIWEILFPGRPRPSSAYMDPRLSIEMRLFREYCSRHGSAALREQIESNPVCFGPEITVEERGLYLDRVISQGINTLFEEYCRLSLCLDSQEDRSVSSSEQYRHNLQPTRFESSTSSIADSGVALGSQPSSSETPFQSVILPRSPGTVDWGYQPATAENRIQGASTMSEDAATLLQSQGQNLPNVSIDGFFEDQIYGSGLPIFDPFQNFGTESNLNHFSQHIQDYEARGQGEMGHES